MSRNWTILLWREKTWSERAQTAVALSAAGVVGIAMFLGVMMVLSLMIENAGQYHEEHDRCMKHATNGDEIEKCR